MPRGKPFVCWLSTEGHWRDVALHIGDEVMFDSPDDGWVRAKIGCIRQSGLYVCRWDGNCEAVWMMIALKPVEGFEYVEV